MEHIEHMKRIEEFMLNEKKFIYFDLSDYKDKNEIMNFIETAKLIIAKYGDNSVYTITNIENIIFNAEIVEIFNKWTEYDKRYVKYAAVIGFSALRKLMAASVFEKSQRENVYYAESKIQAIEYLLAHG